MTEEAYSALIRCKGLRTVLTAIGRSLYPQYLKLNTVELRDDEEKEVLVGSIKSGLKKLAKPQVE
jgi:hypothetical protein